jgi:hypothetical protein
MLKSLLGLGWQEQEAPIDWFDRGRMAIDQPPDFSYEAQHEVLVQGLSTGHP